MPDNALARTLASGLVNAPADIAARAARERPMWREVIRSSGATAD